ncbi:end binding protein 1B [Actinidia rufa]|uniref:Protein ATEB1 homolog 2 n=1 Tax=Actinidia rufa TaxID=165716 RepID=A0A7J0GMT9_9ERIC|nr:end binding protein 1B [Actinidia rufa]
MATNIGMMDSAYFVGRNEILSWINARLQLNLSRIEEAASGAVQCQMMDMTYPGVVPMHKVNFDAKTEYDMIQNYKVLQDVFNKLKIDKTTWLGGKETGSRDFRSRKDKLMMAFYSPMHREHTHVEVNRLVKGRPLDNLEFLQWLKRYCDSINGGIMNENYNPVERRSKGGKERFTKGSRKNSNSLQANNLHNSGSGDEMGPNKTFGTKQGKTGAVATGANSSGEIQALTKEITDLKLSLDALEKERDFYFSKLRDIEILCQTPELEYLPMAVAIKKILYAADAKEWALEEAQEIVSHSE